MSRISRWIGKICIVFSVAFMLIISINWANIFELCYGKNIVVSMPWIVSPLMICSLFLGLLGVITEYVNDICYAYKYHDRKAYINNKVNLIFQAGSNVWWLVSGAILLGLGFIWGYYEYISYTKQYYIDVVDNSIWVLLLVGLIAIEVLFYCIRKYHIIHIELAIEKKEDKKNEDNNKNIENVVESKENIFLLAVSASIFILLGLALYYCISHSVSPICFFWKCDVTLLMSEVIISTILLGANAIGVILRQLSVIKHY